MKSLYKYLYSCLLTGLMLLTSSCVDDEIPMNPSDVESDIPEEIRNGYSVTFNIEVPAMAGENPADLLSGLTNTDLYEIENFVDLDRLRILFFTCADPEKDIKKTSDGREYHTGQHDYFLFESRSRWVSEVTSEVSTSARWQVTAPVFTYGNNEEYDWEAIRWALTNKPFKIVILANRPDYVEINDQDNVFDGPFRYNTQRRPNWGPDDTYIYEESGCRGKDIHKNKEWGKQPTINSLHHCQWDPVYTSRNLDRADHGRHAYDYIMEQPYADEEGEGEAGIIQNPGKGDGSNDNYNLMGAFFYNAMKEPDETDPDSFREKDLPEEAEDKTTNIFYKLPNMEDGIPMYGVQVFEPLKNWKAGTPFNVSNQEAGQSGTYISKNISLLRALVKLELIIPKKMTGSDGEHSLSIPHIYLMYANIMSRCEPMDVSTPTDELWRQFDTDEFDRILNYGPPFREEDKGNANTGKTQEGLEKYHQRFMWYYGAWKEWWHFNQNTDLDAHETVGSNKGSEVVGLSSEYESLAKQIEYQNGQGFIEYPRIFNPMVHRTKYACLDDCRVDNPTDPNYHYVVYTGERYIHDLRNALLGQMKEPDTAELSYIFLKIKDEKTKVSTHYNLPITGYSGTYKNTIWEEYKNDDELQVRYRIPMISNGINNYNWPLVRNHAYIYTITKIGNLMDINNITSKVVASEIRTAPDLVYE